MGAVLEGLRSLDAYPKPDEEQSVKTVTGAVVSVVSHLIMLLLLLSNLSEYLSAPEMAEEIFVDVSRGSKLNINLDLVVPGISCQFLGLDAVDTSGDQHLQITHNIFKRRLDALGQPIEEPQKTESLGSSKADEFKKALEKLAEKKEEVDEKGKCGSCYGAETEELKCCNTCAEVREAYRNKQWSLPEPENIEQCKKENFSEHLKNAFTEGCQIYGYLEVNRAGGSFHVAPGQSFSINHVHVHDVQPFSSSSFNMSHTIRHLSFGQSIRGKDGPLDNHKEIASEGSTMFHYYIKIVPTTYSNLDGQVFHTNQYSVTKHKKVVSHSMLESSGMPGIFFSYELSPMMVRYSETKRSLGHFLTNVCASIGGIYTVASIVDAIIFRLSQRATKFQLGRVN
ncbi:endoplasmic reticulum-Golgi intermediate compartment protein 3 [Neocloeon triangulifer]|uniref:endoplasmic reticulum-Golgi intermediate compartment protein 3 n=1 Tax=Neocloeon triangulifer TaxID=2078957 RepID=UPI00286ECFE9|nr:endoplasmic reticulum-Golgi intermediate compartment protein 3 [Neocloeon triangulifer]